MRQAPIEEPIRVRSRGADGSHSPNRYCSLYGDLNSVNNWKIHRMSQPLLNRNRHVV